MKNDLINEYKEYLSNQNGITFNIKVETLPLMHWKNPVVLRFIIALAKCTLKPISKDVTAIFNLFNKKKLKSTIQKIEFGL